MAEYAVKFSAYSEKHTRYLGWWDEEERYIQVSVEHALLFETKEAAKKVLESIKEGIPGNGMIISTDDIPF